MKTELESMLTSDVGLGSSTILDYKDGYPKPQSVVGFDWSLYEHRKKVLKHRELQVQAVEQWVKNIEDGQTRCIFRMRYIDGMSWVKIAKKVGYGGREDYIRRHIRDKYLEKYKIR